MNVHSPSWMSRGLVAALLAGLLIVAAILAWPAGGAQGEFRSDALVLAGCGSNAPALRVLAEAFRVRHPELIVQIQSIGSTNGIWMAARGAVPAGLVSRALREEELGLGLTIAPYARTPLVLAGHPTVPDDGISTRELLALYQGAHHRWRTGEQVALLTREEGDSSVQLLRRALPGFRRAYRQGIVRGWGTVVYSEQQMHRALTTTPFALGLSDLGTLTVERPPLKALNVNGVAPTLENLASGRYPFAKTLAFVFRPEKVPAELQRFFAFVQSPQGHGVLRAHGYLPLGSERP